MVSLPAKLGLSSLASLIVLVAVFYQTQKRAIWLGFGIGHHIQPINEFPYRCRRIVEAPLKGCEDMWLSESTRQLFLACSDPFARLHWFPAMAQFNHSGRSRDDRVVAVDLDEPKGDFLSYRVLSTPGFTGTRGEGEMHMCAITGIESGEDGQDIKLYLTNGRPSVDEKGELLDQTVVGGNNTIEVFTTGPKASELKHVRTFVHERLYTPNRIALVPGDDEDCYITNDHGPHKLGLRHNISPFLGTGDVTYCNKTSCKQVAGGFYYPNGLAFNRHDGLLYVPSAQQGGIHVYRILPDRSLEKVEFIDINYGIDNLTIDQDGTIWAAAFSKGIDALAAFTDPELKTPWGTAVIRVTKGEDGRYVWRKVLEDRDREVLPGATTVVHDAKTGRLFLSGVISHHITVCDPL